MQLDVDAPWSTPRRKSKPIGGATGEHRLSCRAAFRLCFDDHAEAGIGGSGSGGAGRGAVRSSCHTVAVCDCPLVPLATVMCAFTAGGTAAAAGVVALPALGARMAVRLDCADTGRPDRRRLIGDHQPAHVPRPRWPIWSLLADHRRSCVEREKRRCRADGVAVGPDAKPPG